MKAKAVRLPEGLLHAVQFAEKRERIDEPTAIRKVLRLGAERYVGESYGRGEISLREAADVLGLTTREALELLLDLGVRGNVDAETTLKALSVAEKGHRRRARRR